MRRYLVSSTVVHATFFAFIFLVAWLQGRFWQNDFREFQLIDGLGGGGGGGTGSGGKKSESKSEGAALKQQLQGQVVPQPMKEVAVPLKPGPQQVPTVTAEKPWQVKQPKQEEKKTPPPAPPVDAPLQKGDKPAEGSTNVIRVGKAQDATAGTSQFNFGDGEGGQGGGSGGGSGRGVGIGIGEGTGEGFGGFGLYLRTMRTLIFNQWNDSPLFGSNQSCVVGLTILRSGNVVDIKLEQSSGDGSYDQMALRAVRNASPLQPLPPDFPRDKQRFRIKFRYLE